MYVRVSVMLWNRMLSQTSKIITSTLVVDTSHYFTVTIFTKIWLCHVFSLTDMKLCQSQASTPMTTNILIYGATLEDKCQCT